MMTHEDMLRELELLPVWTLRPQWQMPESKSGEIQTLSVITESIGREAVLQVEDQVDISLESTEFLQPLIAECLPLEQELPIQASKGKPQIKEFLYFASEDGDWLFTLPNKELQPDEAILLRNILVAMRLKAMPIKTLTMTDEDLAAMLPKIIIAMGEATVQHLLQSSEPLIDLRGKLHMWRGIPLVSTYDLAHLLKNLADKSQAWDDLCLAMQTLQEFKLLEIKS